MATYETYHTKCTETITKYYKHDHAERSCEEEDLFFQKFALASSKTPEQQTIMLTALHIYRCKRELHNEGKFAVQLEEVDSAFTEYVRIIRVYGSIHHDADDSDNRDGTDFLRWHKQVNALQEPALSELKTIKMAQMFVNL